MSTKQASQLTQSILASITNTLEQQKNQISKIAKAEKAAKEAYQVAVDNNQAKRSLVANSIKELQAELLNMLENENDAAKQAYEKTLVDLGLKSEDHPFKPITESADKVVTVTLETTGKAARKVANIWDGVKNRFNQGFNDNKVTSIEA
jgi:phenylalanyl-tRNA synthetase alpha subunit